MFFLFRYVIIIFILLNFLLSSCMYTKLKPINVNIPINKLEKNTKKSNFVKFFNKNNGKKLVYFDINYDFSVFTDNEHDASSFDIALHFINYKYPISLGYEKFDGSKESFLYSRDREQRIGEKYILPKTHNFRFYYPLVCWIGESDGTSPVKVIYDRYSLDQWSNRHRFVYVNSFINYQLLDITENEYFIPMDYTSTVYTKLPREHIFRFGFNARVLMEMFDFWFQPSYALNSDKYNYNYKCGIGVVFTNMKAEYFYEKSWGSAKHGLRIGAYMYF